MSIKDEYPRLCAELEKLPIELPDRDQHPIFLREIELLGANIQETVDFLDNYCTGEELAWMSECYSEISERLQSWEFVDALRRCAAKYPKETRDYNLTSFIEDAEGALSDEVYHLRYPKK